MFLGLVKASLGVALLASSAIKNAPDDVVFREINLPSWVRADVYLATRKEPNNHLIPDVYKTIIEALYNRVEV